MSDIQEVFQRIKEQKSKKKDLQMSYSDALKNSSSHQKIAEELKQLKEKKKEIELSYQEEFAKELEDIEDLKLNIKADEEMISDIAITKLMKGEAITFTDGNDVSYEPIFNVKFKKSQ